MTIWYYELSGHDNDSNYFEDSEAPACTRCGLVTELEWINPDFAPRKKTLDLSYTYDLAPIASERFVEFASAFPGVRFLELPSAAGFYRMIVDPVVKVDPTQADRLDWCDVCGRFAQIAGTRAPLPGEQIPVGFSRTDIQYGSARYDRERKTSQNPVMFVDPALAHELIQQRFRGVTLDPIKIRGEG